MTREELRRHNEAVMRNITQGNKQKREEKTHQIAADSAGIAADGINYLMRKGHAYLNPRDADRLMRDVVKYYK